MNSKPQDRFVPRQTDPYPFGDEPEDAARDEARAVHEAYVEEHILAILEKCPADSVAIRYLKQFLCPGANQQPIEVSKREYQKHLEVYGNTAFLQGKLFWIQAEELNNGQVRLSLARPGEEKK